MRPLAPVLAVLGAGLLLTLFGGCGGSTNKSSTDASKPTESMPKPPKADPG